MTTLTPELLDTWATDAAGPVAFCLKQRMLPVEGEGSVFSGPNEGFPVTVTSPDLLFSELVLSPDKKDSEKPPRLPSPLAGPP